MVSAELLVVPENQNAVPDTHNVDRIKRNFLANLNQELRTPLTGILGMLDLLSETSLTEEQLDYVSSSRSCCGFRAMSISIPN